MTYFQRAVNLFKMIDEGKLLEAIGQYYHQDVLVIADDGTERKGKAEALDYDAQLLREIEEIIGRGVGAITANEERGITMVEFWVELKFKNGNRKKLREVAVQHWEGGLIIKEEFYSKK